MSLSVYSFLSLTNILTAQHMSGDCINCLISSVSGGVSGGVSGSI